MTTHVKNWVWIVVWSGSCVMAMMMMQGKNSAFADDGAVSNDVVRYWETRLHGARMPSSVRALVSPLSSREASQLLVNMSASGGHYLPAHAATFCKAAHIQCAQVEKKRRPEDYRSIPFVAHGKELENYNYLHGKELEKYNYFYVDGPLVAHGKELEKYNYLHGKELEKYMYFYDGPQIEAGKKEFEASSQAKPTLQTYEIKDKKAGSDRQISRSFFRRNQVLVRGVDIHVSFEGCDVDTEDAKADRAFLPRKLAKLFPLRGGDGAKIANMLGVSNEDLQDTLDFCNVGHTMKGEVGMCLTSIEDVADFIWSMRGGSPNHGIDMYDAIGNGNASAVELKKAGNIFHVLDVKELTSELDEPAVVCHDAAFPFRVFFCHYIKQTKVFRVILQGKDKSSLERIVICHYDTSQWNPLHMAFVELQTKPGESEVCHWLGGFWLGITGWVFVQGTVASASVM